MQQLDRQRLLKILRYCERIRATVERCSGSFDAFRSDDDLQQSVAFSVLQIGELAGGLSA